MTRAVVVGGGIAGLVAARRLVAAGLEVTVLEAGPVAGGHARTLATDGYKVEWGPHTLTAKATTLLGEAADLAVATAPPDGPGTRYIWRGGKLHALPSGPLSLLTCRVLSTRGWLRLFAEPFVRGAPRAGESVSEFFTRRVGPEATKVLVGSFVSGIHAGDPDALCAEEAFPTLVGYERLRGSIVRGALSAPRKAGGHGLFAPRGGMGALTGAMAASLGKRLMLSTPATGLRRANGWQVETPFGALPADYVVLASPPPTTARLLRTVAPEVADPLLEIPMAPLAVVHFGGADPGGRAPTGFGALIPRGEGVRSLGVLFVGSQLPDRLPGKGTWLHAAFIGGATDPKAIELSDEELIRIAVADSVKLTGFSARPTFTRIVRHTAAIPQRLAGHRERVAAAAGRFDDVVLAGNWVRGVSAEDAAVSGVEAAKAVLERVPARRAA